MQNIQKQKGLSAIAWLFFISLFGFTLLIASKLLPHYLDNRFVVSTLKTLGDDPELARLSRSDIRAKLRKTFTINNIRGKATESVNVTKNKNNTIVTIEYEERVNLLQNIDVVLTFNSYLDSSNPSQCCRAPKK